MICQSCGKSRRILYGLCEECRIQRRRALKELQFPPTQEEMEATNETLDNIIQEEANRPKRYTVDEYRKAVDQAIQDSNERTYSFREIWNGFKNVYLRMITIYLLIASIGLVACGAIYGAVMLLGSLL